MTFFKVIDRKINIFEGKKFINNFFYNYKCILKKKHTSNLIKSKKSFSNTHNAHNENTIKIIKTVDRELPDPFKQKKLNRKYMIVYTIGIIIACTLIFNYEKTSSSVITSALYFSRKSKKLNELIGNNIDFKSKFPWISGTLNTMKGIVDINFKIKGNSDYGIILLKAKRESYNDPFKIEHFNFSMKKNGNFEVVYDFLSDSNLVIDI